MTTAQLIDKFINGATSGSASSLRIDGDTLYSYAYPLASRWTAGPYSTPFIEVNTGASGATIADVNPALMESMAFNAAQRSSYAREHMEQRRATYYDARDAAYSATTNKARRAVISACERAGVEYKEVTL